AASYHGASSESYALLSAAKECRVPSNSFSISESHSACHSARLPGAGPQKVFHLIMIKSFVATNAKHLANFLSFVVTRCLAIAVFAVSVPIFINQTSGEEYGIVAIGFSLLG